MAAADGRKDAHLDTHLHNKTKKVILINNGLISWNEE